MKNTGVSEIEEGKLCNFVPRQSEPDHTFSSPGDNSGECSPSKIFKRHRSLAELSSVAVLEKQALDKENSQASETSETSSQGFEFSEGNEKQAKEPAIIIEQDQQAQTVTVQSTPTKSTEVNGFNNNDPLTPTANLKMLMSVVSPAIRDREEKKKDLFLYTDSVDNVAEEVIVEKQAVYSRKDKSLGRLCQRFLAKFPENPGDNPIEICLDEVSKDLKVERRRVYDIVNVLESVEVLSRVAKNRYLWHGKTRIAQTLGRLKVLSRSQDDSLRKKGKENIRQTNKSKPKMKRHYSTGDVPSKKGSGNRQPLKDKNLTKEDERRRIKAAIESTDHCRKDKSLGVLSQKFLIMFLMSKGGVVTLEDAANVLLEEQDEGNVKYKTKVRRLYDIANILSSLMLIEKVHIRGPSGKKPGFKWIGVDIDSLPESMCVLVPPGPVVTFKTKHSLLPEPTVFLGNKCAIPCAVGQPLLLPSSTVNKETAVPKRRWSKSASCSASLVSRRPSGSCSLSEKKSKGDQGGNSEDGFLVHEFASSPVNVLERDVPLYSPTEITFREELQKLKEKYPNHMSKLLTVLPNSPSPYGNANKTSRRNLFNQSNAQLLETGEPTPKRSRANSVGELQATQNRASVCVISELPVVGVEETNSTNSTNNENIDSEKVDSQTKFMHSTNSPFKIMPSCSYRQTNDCQTVPANTSVPASTFNCNEILQERQKQQVLLQEQHRNHQIVETKWRQMVEQLRTHDPSAPRTIQLVDQALSPIPPAKLAPGKASIAVQASLIKDVSPLKPLMFVHHRIPSPWKLPAGSPSSAPPAPPTTPELPNELSVAAFQSQANTLYLRNMSPYPSSQSCGNSPVTPFSGVRQFFPPSPSPPTNTMQTNLVFSQANLVYKVNQIMAPSNAVTTPSPINHYSNSCPSSINPSPTMVDPARSFTSGVTIPGIQATVVGAATVLNQKPQTFSRPATVSPSSLQAQNVTAHCLSVTEKTPCMMVNDAGGLGATPGCMNMSEISKDNVSRKLCLSNGHS